MMTYRRYLEDEFDKRARRNPSYSLRAYARDLEFPVSKLSEILRGRCGLSRDSATGLARRIGLSADEIRHFVLLVEAEHGRSALSRKRAKEALTEIEAVSGMGELDLERFKVISDWFHFALLELTEVKGFRSSATWIGRRLGISAAQAREAVDRLLDFGLLRRKADGEFEQTEQHLATPNGIPSRQIREHHSQILQKADQALEDVPVELREFSSTTLSIASEDLPELKKMLLEFRRRFARKAQETEDRDRVYCLALQFFPLDQIDNQKSGEKP